MAAKPTPTPNPETLMDTEPGGENTQYEGAKVFLDQTGSESKSLGREEGGSQFGKSSEIHSIFHGLSFFSFCVCVLYKSVQVV